MYLVLQLLAPPNNAGCSRLWADRVNKPSLIVSRRTIKCAPEGGSKPGSGKVTWGADTRGRTPRETEDRISIGHGEMGHKLNLQCS